MPLGPVRSLTLIGAGVFAIATSYAGANPRSVARATRVVRVEPPPSPEGATRPGICAARSLASAIRSDALRCVANGAVLDPCFATARPSVAWCPGDPRDRSGDTLVNRTPGDAGTIPAASGLNRAWFIELADGSTCRAVTTDRHVIDGEIENYTCTFSSPGDADAVVLGDVDDTAALWTIKKAALNKKFTPQTIKSLNVVVVTTAWR